MKSTRMARAIDQFYPRWVIATALSLTLLLAYAPLGLESRSTPIAIIFGFGPLYMLHQIEEHVGDRFRRYANLRIFGGREALTREAVLWINLPLVWGGNLLALYAAALVGPGWGLAAAYLAGLNAVSHVAAALRFGEYNPGLASATFLFLPAFAIAVRDVPADVRQHAAAATIAVAAHLVIIASVLSHARRLRG